MPGVIFQEAPSVTEVSPNRADVVCFIGFLARRQQPIPRAVKTWLLASGWPTLSDSLLEDGQLDETEISPVVRASLLNYGWPQLRIQTMDQELVAFTPLSASDKQWLIEQGWRQAGAEFSDYDDLLDTPIPVESFEAFDRLFAWEQRPVTQGSFAHPTWMGSAVRAFFRQGGARCVIVRVGDPWAYNAVSPNESEEEKDVRTTRQAGWLELILPGFRGSATPSPNDRNSWKGVGVLLGLNEPAFVCLPDLPEIVADAATELPTLPEPEPGAEVFVECSSSVVLSKEEVRQISSAPACSAEGFQKWFETAHYAAKFVRSCRRDVELILAVPLGPEGKRADTLKSLSPDGNQGLGASLDENAGIATAFLQLAFPWLLTSWSEGMPGGIEPPDGALAGAIARSVAYYGAHQSAAGEALRGVQETTPGLLQHETKLETERGEEPALIHRVSLLGPTPTGWRVLSDVTTSLDKAHRPACVGRLTAAILRTAKRAGETLVFEPSGPDLWRKLEDRIGALLSDFYAAGALNGETRQDAYSVRCDETTTSQNDLDNGRVLVVVQFAPAHPIDLITVVLSLRDGSVTVAEGGG